MSDPDGRFSHLPTAAVDLVQRSTTQGPEIDDPSWEPDAQPLEPQVLDRGFAGWALGFAIAGLGVSLFVGWGFVIGIVAITSAILALRRPQESRAIAVWALALAAVSLAYSAGWLLYAGMRADLLG